MTVVLLRPLHLAALSRRSSRSDARQRGHQQPALDGTRTLVMLLSLLHPVALLKTARGSDASPDLRTPVVLDSTDFDWFPSLTPLAARSIWASGEERSKAQESYRGLHWFCGI